MKYILIAVFILCLLVFNKLVEENERLHHLYKHEKSRSEQLERELSDCRKEQLGMKD